LLRRAPFAITNNYGHWLRILGISFIFLAK
jgi:hypothetical protein